MEIEDKMDRNFPKNIKWFIVSSKLLQHKSKTIIENVKEIFDRDFYRYAIRWIYDNYKESGDVERKDDSGR